jgi:hypothetical protein
MNLPLCAGGVLMTLQCKCKLERPSIKYCPFCGNDAIKHVKTVPRCTYCRAVFHVAFSRYAHRSTEFKKNINEKMYEVRITNTGDVIVFGDELEAHQRANDINKDGCLATVHIIDTDDGCNETLD